MSKWALWLNLFSKFVQIQDEKHENLVKSCTWKSGLQIFILLTCPKKQILRWQIQGVGLQTKTENSKNSMTLSFLDETAAIIRRLTR